MKKVLLIFVFIIAQSYAFGQDSIEFSVTDTKLFFDSSINLYKILSRNIEDDNMLLFSIDSIKKVKYSYRIYGQTNKPNISNWQIFRVNKSILYPNSFTKTKEIFHKKKKKFFEMKSKGSELVFILNSAQYQPTLITVKLN